MMMMMMMMISIDDWLYVGSKQTSITEVPALRGDDGEERRLQQNDVSAVQQVLVLAMRLL